MIRVHVRLSGIGADVPGILAALADRTDLHDAMRDGAENLVRDHLRGLNGRSPNTSFYGQAAASVESSADAQGATVRVPHRGVALRYYGGTVTAGASISSHTGQPTKAIAVPTAKVPVANQRRLAPREAGVLAFIPNRGGDIHTSGFLVEGMLKRITRGKNKGKNRAVPKPGGVMMYVLRRLTTHRADPTVMPTRDALGAAGVAAAEGYLDSFRNGGVA